MSKTDLALVSEKDLSKVENNSLNQGQMQILLSATPKTYVKTRPAKGGGTWEYVTGGYVKKCLNLIFGWDWNFEIVDEKIMIEAGEVVVKGRLTCNSNGRTIVKMQYGNKDIMFKNDWIDGKKVKTNIPLSIGNDMKAAATDCLKKCAAEIGVAADIYNKEDFKAVTVVSEDNLKEAIEKKFEAVRSKMQPEDIEAIEQVLIEENEKEYKRIINVLNKVR